MPVAVCLADLDEVEGFGLVFTVPWAMVVVVVVDDGGSGS